MNKKKSDLVSIALERTYRGDRGFEFENFCQNLCKCQLGNNFFATSPFKDGGIDGFYMRIDNDYVVTRLGKPEVIYQFGTTIDYEDKIINTYNDLKRKNINVKKIHYYTPHSISNITQKINTLEDKLDIAISIVDHAQICSIVSTKECNHIFDEFITTMIGTFDSNDDKNITLDYPVLYLNAWYRYEKSEEHNNTIMKMTDSLIIWALRDTDPVQKNFMTSEEIYNNIEKNFPSAKNTIKSIYEGRIKALLKKRTDFGRQVIQKHKNSYCLPVESRKDYEEKEQESKQILLLAKAGFSDRLQTKYNNDSRREQLVELMLHIIKQVFTERGMRFVETLTDSESEKYDEIYLRDATKKASHDLESYVFKDSELNDASVMLRQVFANPSEFEQEYLVRTSYLYMMHYIMHNDIGIVSYFQERTKRLNLIVHSDVLIRALSEEYLPKAGQQYRNILFYLNSMGTKLLVTEESIIEIYNNLKIATLEYQHYIQNFENFFTIESIKFLPVLMTRAYLYSKREGKVESWNNFINRFLDPKSIFSNESKAKEDLKIYLTDKFNLQILRKDEVEKEINTSMAQELVNLISPHKKKIELARHVASVNIYISTMRHKNNEISKSPFGYQTYWLTHEKTVYTIAKDFFDKNELGTRLIMRPEFIMQQIMLTPDGQSIADSYSATFPTALGVQMSQQLDIANFKIIMKKLKEISDVDLSRAKAILNDVIQMAAEETILGESNKHCCYQAQLNIELDGMGGELKDKLQKIIDEADKRDKLRKK